MTTLVLGDYSDFISVLRFWFTMTQKSIVGIVFVYGSADGFFDEIFKTDRTGPLEGIESGGVKS